jgi:hypothetical protein
MKNKTKQNLQKQEVIRTESMLYELTASIIKKESSNYPFPHEPYEYFTPLIERNFGVSYSQWVLMERVPIDFRKLQSVPRHLTNKEFYYIQLEFRWNLGSTTEYYFVGISLEEIQPFIVSLKKY